MRSSKKIFFERIRFVHYPMIFFYLRRGYKIYVFDFSFDLKRRFLLRRLINQEKIHRIYISPLFKAHGVAIDQAEVIYQKFKTGPLQKNIAKLYESDETELVLKKAVAEDLFKSFFIHEYLSAQEGISFIPEYYPLHFKFISKFGNFHLKVLQGVQIPKWALFISFLSRVVDRWVYLGGGFFNLLFKIALITIGKGLGFRKSFFQDFTNAIAIHQSLDIKFQNKRGFDFLIDGRSLTLENTVFLLYMPVAKEWLSLYQARGYHFLSAENVVGEKNPLRNGFSARDLHRALFALLKFPFCKKVLYSIALAYLRSVRVFINYQLMASRISFKNYIYTNQESPNQIALNILVRKHGGQTWHYLIFVGGGYLYAENKTEYPKHRNILWAFLNSDHFLSVNEGIMEYYRFHSQKIRHYHVIGNIFSEMVRESFNGHNSQQYAKEGKIISFFDTSFVDDETCTTTYDDAIFFYEDIIRLLQERSDFFAIIKPSKDEFYFVDPKSQWSSLKKGKKIMQLWEVLKKNPKVFWAGDKGDTPAIMAASDLVITHCLSSPTVEALGGRKKAIWYMSRRRHLSLIYDDIPGLKVYGYDALKNRVEELLDKVDGKEYDCYLDTYVKGRVEPFLDGLALTRFRNLLHENN